MQGYQNAQDLAISQNGKHNSCRIFYSFLTNMEFIIYYLGGYQHFSNICLY